jgi:hypothetical protein
MRLFKPFPLVSTTLFLVTLSVAGQTSTYSDPTTGVTFQYPSVWKKVPKPDAMTQPMFIMAGINPVIDVEFSPKGNLYEKTNLVGLDFLYYTAPATNAAACAKIAVDTAGTDSKPDTKTIHGVAFQHIQTSNSGMCHEMSAEIYSVYRNGVCHLFEEDFMNVCAGVVEGTRGLTDTETKALQRHLDAIMQSVIFAPLKP